ncbi:MAG: class I SAM-dependent methyltransferase [Anaerolineales bacterium]|jgi:SAM-dependent methyltransferase
MDHMDNGNFSDWGKTSRDYAAYRPGYPEEFYDLLSHLGIGVPGQKILDLGTGTGVLARVFAERGALVTGVDIAEDQIREARRLSAEEQLEITYTVSNAENIDYAPDSFDAATAGQSWMYFDTRLLVPRLKRILKDRGRLVLTHLNWLPRRDPIARMSEALVLKFNPHWTGADYDGTTPPELMESLAAFRLTTFHTYESALPFSRESWRGRIRACRGVGASLPPERVAEFDREHAVLLEKIAPPEFTILHQIVFHIFENVKS